MNTTASAVALVLRGAGCVFAEDEAAALVAEARDSAHLAEMVDDRVAGTPLEHVLGWAEFCGMRVVVAPGVFVPRRRTELLVREAAALLVAAHRLALGPVSGPPVVVDLCCGSGAVGAVLAVRCDVDLYAADIDPVAVRCARRTVRPASHVLEGDLFDALPDRLRGQVDVLVANTPYVPTEEIAFMPAEARDYEPHHTLDGGRDGLDLHRRVAAGAGEWLAPGGHLLVETSERQTAGTVAIFRAAGLDPRVVHDEEIDATVVVGRRPLDRDDAAARSQRAGLARWAHALVAVVALVGVVMELTLTVVDGPDEAGTMIERLVRLFSYFTILSNIAIGAVSIATVIDPWRDGRGFRVAHLDALLCIAVTGLVYNTVLRGIVELSQAGAVSNFLLHVASPLAAVVVWVLVGPRPRVDVRTVLLSVVAPILWLVYTFGRGALVDWYPYPFLDAGELGLWPALLSAGTVAVLFLALAFVLRWVDGKLRAAP